MTHIGHVKEIVRYPIKSMAGVPTETAFLGWHGLDGDRRFAFRRSRDNSGFPWLSASRLPQLLLYHPFGLDESTGEPLPTHIQAPGASSLAISSPELNTEISERFGSNVELMNLKHGIFDEGTVSILSLATIAGIAREAGLDLDPRRFRANILLETEGREPFLEDEWVGGMLIFGDGNSPACVSVTQRDERCMMINLDPDTATQDARVMKTVVRLNNNYSGVYATTLRTGTIRVGDRVTLVSHESPSQTLIARFNVKESPTSYLAANDERPVNPSKEREAPIPMNFGAGLHTAAGQSVDVSAYERYLGRWSRLFVASLLDAAEIRTGDRVLDVATGPGAAAMLASEAASCRNTVIRYISRSHWPTQRVSRGYLLSPASVTLAYGATLASARLIPSTIIGPQSKQVPVSCLRRISRCPLPAVSGYVKKCEHDWRHSSPAGGWR